LRWKNLHQWETRRGLNQQSPGGIRKGVEYIRNAKPDAGALLILRDEDDACPRDLAPEIADELRQLNAPFPVAYVLLHPEYEVLFLPCLDKMTGPFPDGRRGLLPDTQWDGPSWESRRGIKERLSKRFPSGRTYKPTLDQLPMTQKLSFPTLREADVPCFGSLERAIRFLSDNFEQPGAVYP